MGEGNQRTSLTTTGGPGRAPNRAMLRAVGFTDDDFDRPVIGVASLASDITPCNAHLDRLAQKGRDPWYIPCTPNGVMFMLDRVGVQLEGANAVVLGRSNIVGMPVALGPGHGTKINADLGIISGYQTR